jgi:hypothetical protein
MFSGRNWYRCLNRAFTDPLINLGFIGPKVSPLKSDGIACHGNCNLDSIGVYVGVRILYL